MFRSDFQPTRIVALWQFTPFPFNFTLAGKPWAAVSSLSLLAMVVALACVMVEGPDLPQVESFCARIAGAIEREMGA